MNRLIDTEFYRQYCNNVGDAPFTTKDKAINGNYKLCENSPGTRVETVFTIIKSEPPDSNLLCLSGHTEPLVLDGVSVKREPGYYDQEDSNDNLVQITSNTIIKEEIMIESEHETNVFEVPMIHSLTNPAKSNENQKFAQRKKKVLKNWQKDMTFASEIEALEVVKNERIWARHTKSKTGKGNKVIYRCRNVKSKGLQCDAGLYLLYEKLCSNVTIFRSANSHTCDSIDSRRKPMVKRPKMVKCDNVPVSSINNSSLDVTIENQNPLKRRKRVVKNWQKEAVFDMEENALSTVKNELAWAKHTTNKTDKGNKVVYRCKHVKSKGQQCAAGVYLLYSNSDSSVTLFRSFNRHTCNTIDTTRKPYVRVKIKTKTKTKAEPTSNNENRKKRRKRVGKNWQKAKTFEMETDALAAVSSEETWTKHTTNKTDNGKKVIYRCRNVKSKGQQCEAGVYLLYGISDDTVTMFRSGNRHTCPIIESKSKSVLTHEAKSIIRREYEKGYKQKQIYRCLAASGITSFTNHQINHYLYQLRRGVYEDNNLQC